MNEKRFVVGLLVVLAIAFGLHFSLQGDSPDPDTGNNENNEIILNKFNSIEELNNYIQKNTYSYNYYGYWDDIAFASTALEDSSGSASPGSSDYSSTNIQVEGVDEADFVKTDGKYIYVVSGENLLIVDAYPAENAELLSETNLDFYPSEFFVNKDKLIIFGYEDSYYSSESIISIYDVSDRENPEQIDRYYAEGYYFDSRMIGDYVYVVVNEPAYYYDEVEPPEILLEGQKVGNSEVYYFDEPAYSYMFTTIISFNLEDNSMNNKIYLTGYTQDMYVSEENIYLTNKKVPLYSIYSQELPDTTFSALVEIVGHEVLNEELTSIHKISIKNGNMTYVAEGEVPGNVLNQFSMDEYEGNFRIATTIGQVWQTGSNSKNNVYVLDENLNKIGELEDLAPGERIYSARFMGERCYIVTFKKVDPLFVIDLSNPENPEVLGQLKIPGYSDYLHPYDENHVIGIGKETVEAEEGDFAWYQGVKLSLFDVSDVEHPKEIAKFVIGDRGTDSYALYDHKAFLFSKEKNLLVIPVLVAEIDEEKYPSGVPDNTYGDYVWQGAYVFNINPEDGFELKGGIAHVEDPEYFEKMGYYYSSDYSVKRSLYMDDVLYTISNEKIKMNNLDDLSQVNEVDLPYEAEDYYYW